MMRVLFGRLSIAGIALLAGGAALARVSLGAARGNRGSTFRGQGGTVMKKLVWTVRAAVIVAALLAVGFMDGSDRAAAGAETPVGSDMTPAPLGTININIRADIDGRSRLIIQGNGIHWQHYTKAAPGRENVPPVGSDPILPTYVNDAAWYPVWPDSPNPENRDCGGCVSSTYNPDPPLPPMANFVRIEQVGYGCRGTCEVIEAPTSANGFKLVVEFNDDDPYGSAWYEINIVTFLPLVGGMQALPDVAQGTAPTTPGVQESSSLPYAVIAGAAAGAALLAAGGLYARRRYSVRRR
jgi:hypothetical protein